LHPIEPKGPILSLSHGNFSESYDGESEHDFDSQFK
jgi:hypothetical protein